MATQSIELTERVAATWRARYRLTARETQVLVELLTDKAYGAIALHLGITLNTLKTHVKSVTAKLGIDRRAGLAALLLSVEPDARVAGTPRGPDRVPRTRREDKASEW